MADAGQTICSDIVTYLNSQTYTMKFTPTAPEDPHLEINFDDMGTPHEGVRVFVIPISESEEKKDRGGCVAVRQVVNLFVSRFMRDEDGITRTTMQSFTSELRTSLRFQDMQTWAWESTETITKYDAEKLRTQGRFLSVLQLTYWDVE